MTIAILLASILVTAIVAWLLRRRLAASILARLPRKETVTTALLFASIALLLVIALLPDLLILFSTVNLMPHSLRMILGLAAASMVCIGCSKHAEPAKPAVIHWKGQDGGYQDTTPTQSAVKSSPTP